MRKKTLLFGGAVVMLGAMILVSCNKSAEIKSTNTTTTVTAESKTAGNKLISLQDLSAIDEADQLTYALDPSAAVTVALKSGSCPPIITYDNPEGVYPRTVTTDWGTGCSYKDGISRSGKVFRTYFGDMADTTQNSYYLETYDNYYVKDARVGWDSVKFEGTLKMRHESRNTDPQNSYRSTSRNRKLTELNGDFVIYNGVKKISKNEDDGLYPGVNRNGWYKFQGVQTGDVLSSGVSYQFVDSIDAANPTILRHCDFISTGRRIITFSNQPTWELNYGAEVRTCDDQAELTISGVTTTVTLPLAFW